MTIDALQGAYLTPRTEFVFEKSGKITATEEVDGVKKEILVIEPTEGGWKEAIMLLKAGFFVEKALPLETMEETDEINVEEEILKNLKEINIKKDGVKVIDDKFIINTDIPFKKSKKSSK